MLPNVIEFLSSYPLLGVDDASLSVWRSECESSWSQLSKDYLSQQEAVRGSMLLSTLLSSYTDLARLVATKQYESTVSWTLEQRRKCMQVLCAATQVEQRTQQWYTDAANLLTASQFQTILKSGRTRALLVEEKALANVDTSQRLTTQRTQYLNPFLWGIRFEPVVKDIYEALTQTKVREMGRLRHRTNPRLAASPDGLVEAGPDERLGRFVEFKAPVTRPIINKIPEEYMTQMQIQMEVGDIEECDYLEVKFQSEYPQKVIPPQPTSTRNHPVFYGSIAILGVDAEKKYRYEYSPLNTFAWKPVVQPGEDLLEMVPWWTDTWYLKTVGRSRPWFSATVPHIDAFWHDVEQYKIGKFVVPVSTRTKKDSICRIIETSSEEMVA